MGTREEMYTMLTPEQQAQAEELRPVAQARARRYRDDEAQSVADVALCEAVFNYKPDRGMSIRAYVDMAVFNALRNWDRRVRFERRIGTAGGAPSREQIESCSARGRRTRRTQEEVVAGCSRSLDEAIPSHESAIPRLVALLPKRLQPIATCRWLQHKTLHETAEALGITLHETRRQCEEAEGFARLYYSGGML